MVVDAAVQGLGAAVRRSMLIARAIEQRALVPLFDRRTDAPERCCLIATAASLDKPEVQVFRKWIVREANRVSPAASRAARNAASRRS